MRSTEPDGLVLREVRRFWKRHNLPRGIRILAAASAGPDSTALASALAELRGELGFGMVLAHYDHGIRSAAESEADLAFAKNLAESLGVEFTSGTAGPGVIAGAAKDSGRSLEDEARRYRHRFLRRAASGCSCGYIALGHTASDRRETQIMRFFQGASPEGLRGMQERRGMLIRPLSGVDKKAALDYLARIGRGFRDDHTNEDPAFLRNHLRRRLLPAAEEVFPGFGKALDKLALKARLYEDFAAESLDRLDPWKSSGPDRVCRLGDFLALHPLLRMLSVYRLFDAKTGPEVNPRLPFAFLAPLARLGEKTRNGIVLRGRGRRLEAKGGLLFWKQDIVLEPKKGYLYVVDGEAGIEVPGRILIRVEEASPAMRSENTVFPCGRNGYLIVRSRRPGDGLRTGGGNKTLKKMFSDMRIPENLRDVVPVVQGGNGIMGVLTEPWGTPTIRAPESATEEHGDARCLRFRVITMGEERG